MQRKIIIDTCVYIEIFNKGRFTEEINWFKNITYLSPTVFHELMIGAKTKKETNALIEIWETFSRLDRIGFLTEDSLFQTGTICHQMKKKGKLDPVNPKHYNDITIAVTAKQIDATILTLNKKDFTAIKSIIDVECDFLT